MSPNRISRRRMLKRIGATTALAWSAPVLSSLRTPAFAQYIGCSPCTNPFTCAGEELFQCGETPGCPVPQCLCLVTTEGDCFCLQNTTCPLPECDTSADCPGETRCVPSCGCGGKPTLCFQPCGTCPARTTRSTSRTPFDG